MKITKTFLLSAGLITAVCAVSACQSDENVEYTYPERVGKHQYTTDGETPDKLFGPDGIVLIGKEKPEDAGSTGIGVNSYLWRGTLDTLSFMPLASADPFGGVIITDWYSPADTPNDRFKINAFILSKSLRADGIRVTVFKQVKKNGEWKEAKVPENAASSIEDAILVKARQLRIAQQPQK